MHIQSYRFGHIQIDGKVYKNDIKIIDGEVFSEWWRNQGHFVDMKDVNDLLTATADTCIFGTGAYGSMRVSKAVVQALKKKGMDVFMGKTSTACDRFNALNKKGRKVIAGFHLTC